MKISLRGNSIGAKIFFAMAIVTLFVFAMNYLAVLHFTGHAFDRAVAAMSAASDLGPQAHKDQALSYVRWRALSISGLTLLAGFALFVLLIHFILRRPMSQLLAASRALANNAGDLTTSVDIRSDDELGRLGFALNELFSNMAGIIRMIRAIADKVNFSAQNLSAATEQMNSITEETSTTVQNIAKSTDVQARRVDDMIKEIRNMERSVKQVANSAELAAAAATNASETAAKGGDSAKEAVEKINTIYTVIQESAEIIRHLGERSNQIDEIVDVITDVADQTNLLALNAAIEAARAGEAGAGFAVVADEVRKLAEGSARAAEEIAALIRQTQDETRTAVKSIELGAKEVTEGKDVITRTGQSLDEIVEVLRSSSDMARRISAATKELSRGMKNVTGSIDEISSSAEKNASATQETAASMEQMTSSMEDVASSAQKLSDMAIQLREHVGKFSVGPSTHVDETAAA
jgi:methyl-accepting chemotaxis protein